MPVTGGRLIDSSGNVRLGVFSEPISEVNYRDYELLTPFGRPAGRWARHFGFKQFHMPVSGTAFEYDQRDLMKPWKLGSADGCLQLDFEPQICHAEKLNAWVAASNFNQLLGRYRGRLIAANGEEICIAGMLGYAESHYAKW